MRALDQWLTQLRRWLDVSQQRIESGNTALNPPPPRDINTETDFLLNAYMNTAQDLSHDVCFGANGYFVASASSNHNDPPTSTWPASSGRAFRAPLVSEWVWDDGFLVPDPAHPSTSPTNTWDVHVDLHTVETVRAIRIDTISAITQLSVWTTANGYYVPLAYFEPQDMKVTNWATVVRHEFDLVVSITDLFFKITTDGGGVCRIAAFAGADTPGIGNTPAPDDPDGPNYMPLNVFSNDLENADSTWDLVNGPADFTGQEAGSVPFPGGYFLKLSEAGLGYLSIDDGQTWTSTAVPTDFTTNQHVHLRWDQWSGKLLALPVIGGDLFALDPATGVWTQADIYDASGLGAVYAPEVPRQGVFNDEVANLSHFFTDDDGLLAPVFYGRRLADGQHGFLRPRNKDLDDWEFIQHDQSLWISHQFGGEGIENDWAVRSITRDGDGYWYVHAYFYWRSGIAGNNRYYEFIFSSVDLVEWEDVYWIREVPNDPWGGIVSLSEGYPVERVWARENGSGTLRRNGRRLHRYGPNNQVVLIDGPRGVRLGQGIQIMGQSRRGFSKAFNWYVPDNNLEQVVSTRYGLWALKAFSVGFWERNPTSNLYFPAAVEDKQMAIVGWYGGSINSPTYLLHTSLLTTLLVAAKSSTGSHPTWPTSVSLRHGGDRLLLTGPGWMYG